MSTYIPPTPGVNYERKKVRLNLQFKSYRKQYEALLAQGWEVETQMNSGIGQAPLFIFRRDTASEHKAPSLGSFVMKGINKWLNA